MGFLVQYEYVGRDLNLGCGAHCLFLPYSVCDSSSIANLTGYKKVTSALLTNQRKNSRSLFLLFCVRCTTWCVMVEPSMKE